MHGMRDSEEVATKRIRTHSAMLLFIVARILQDTSYHQKKKEKKERGNQIRDEMLLQAM